MIHLNALNEFQNSRKKPFQEVIHILFKYILIAAS